MDWGELRPARVVKPDTGRAVYESVTRRRVDPALGEWAGSGRYSARIFPIPPGGFKRVVFAYDQTLPAAAGSVLYPLPLPAELPPGIRVTVHDLSPAAVDAALVAGDRTLAGRRTNRGRVWGFEPEAGFRGSLVYTARQARPEIQLLVGRDPAIPGKLVHLRVTPPLPARRGPAATGRALFLLDTSRSGKERLWSMSGRLLRSILERDESISAFALLAFDVQPYPADPGFTANTPAAREKLLADVERIRLEGATSFESVLERLAADGRLAEADTVFLLSDGAITWGEDDPGRLQSRFPELLAKRWICYAPAEAPHNEALFRALTRSGGQVVGVAVGQDPASAADAHRSSFSRLTGLHTARQDELLLPGGRPERLYPGQVLEIGAVLPEDRREIELLLGIDGETVRIAAPLAEIPEAEAIAARAWADLYARLLAERPDEGAVEAIQRLSGHFSLTNSHASFIILETDEEYGQHGIIAGGLDYPALRQALKYATGAPVPEFPSDWIDADTGRLLASLEQVPLRPAWRAAPRRKAEADASLLLAPPAYEPAGDAPRKIHALARELAAASLPAAYRVLSSVAEVSPTDDQALRLVGFQLMEWAMYGEAEDLFARVRRRRPFEPQNALLEAVALAATGRAREAALRYEYVLRTDFPRFTDYARPVAGRLYADLLRSLLAADGSASEGGGAAEGGPDAELWRRRLAELALGVGRRGGRPRPRGAAGPSVEHRRHGRRPARAGVGPGHRLLREHGIADRGEAVLGQHRRAGPRALRAPRPLAAGVPGLRELLRLQLRRGRRPGRDLRGLLHPRPAERRLAGRLVHDRARRGREREGADHAALEEAVGGRPRSRRGGAPRAPYRVSRCRKPWMSPRAEPAVAVGVQGDAVRALGRRRCCGLHQQVHQRALPRTFQLQGHLVGLVVEVVQDHQRAALPGVAHPQHLAEPVSQHPPLPPADLGALLAHADHRAHPVQQRAGVAPLLLHVDVPVAVRPLAHHRVHRPGGLGEARLRLVGPLHRRAHRVPLREAQVVAHADLVAVAQHRRAGQREQQAVGQLDAPPVAAASAPAAGGCPGRRAACASPGRSASNTSCALLLGEPARGRARRGCAGTAPTARRRQVGARRLQRLDQRVGVRRWPARGTGAGSPRS